MTGLTGLIAVPLVVRASRPGSAIAVPQTQDRDASPGSQKSSKFASWLRAIQLVIKLVFVSQGSAEWCQNLRGVKMNVYANGMPLMPNQPKLVIGTSGLLCKLDSKLDRCPYSRRDTIHSQRVYSSLLIGE